MSEGGIARVRELLRRAGLGEVSPVALAGIAAVAAVILVIALWRWGPSSGGETFELEQGVAAGSEETAAVASAPESSEPSSVVVHVVGAVRHPGVVLIAAGGRVSGAVDAAGGMLPNAAQEGLNLARVVTDGEQIIVLTRDEWESAQGAASAAGGTGAAGAPGLAGAAAAAGAGGATSGAGPPVNLNTASESQLDALPGVGPSTAAKIVADRESGGPFASPEDLMRVPGIGEKKFDALKDLIVVR